MKKQHLKKVIIILNSKSATLDTDNFFAIKEAAIKYNEPVIANKLLIKSLN